MDDCTMIDRKMEMKMVKTLFLCNRKKTVFYLFITTGEKAFDTKAFSNALGISRVSFAPAELMEEMLGSKVGGGDGVWYAAGCGQRCSDHSGQGSGGGGMSRLQRRDGYLLYEDKDEGYYREAPAVYQA